MRYQEPLSQMAVAVSISDSPDMPELGLSEEHLRDAMAEVARHLLAMGARLVYGGDLRSSGFTSLLFELVARHRRDADIGDERLGVVSYLPWPVHSQLSPVTLREMATDLAGYAEVHFLDQQGVDIPLDQLGPGGHNSSAEEWSQGLTAMRGLTTRLVNARVVLGGGIANFKGKMPGIAEEALLSLQTKQPVFLLGGFGGCANDLATELGLTASKLTTNQWSGRQAFSTFTASSLNNGLSDAENQTLAQSVHVDEIVALTLRGLLRLAGDPNAPAS